MSAGQITLLVGLAILVVVVAIVIATLVRRRRLRSQFREEYDRTIDLTGSRRKAEHELIARTRRHDELDIVPLPPEMRTEFRSRWARTQSQFVDEPQAATAEADHLLKQVMTQRGYPIGSFDQQTADLSVEHAAVLSHYRRANDIAENNKRGRATTEDLRQAMVHYRTLFEDLIETREPARTERSRA